MVYVILRIVVFLFFSYLLSRLFLFLVAVCLNIKNFIGNYSKIKHKNKYTDADVIDICPRCGEQTKSMHVC